MLRRHLAVQNSHLYHRTAQVGMETSGVHPHQTSISIARTFLCPSVSPATCREAVMCNREVMRGIASGQLHFPTFSPRQKQFRFNSILKKNIKPLIGVLLAQAKRGEGLSGPVCSALKGEGLH